MYRLIFVFAIIAFLFGPIDRLIFRLGGKTIVWLDHEPKSIKINGHEMKIEKIIYKKNGCIVKGVVENMCVVGTNLRVYVDGQPQDLDAKVNNSMTVVKAKRKK